jgi:hypothetical protein
MAPKQSRAMQRMLLLLIIHITIKYFAWGGARCKTLISIGMLGYGIGIPTPMQKMDQSVWFL